jgi:hypothetical protein
VLVLLTAVALNLLVSDLSGYVIRDDWRLARAIVEHRQNPSGATQRELDDATCSFQRHRATERVGVALVLFSLCD